MKSNCTSYSSFPRRPTEKNGALVRGRLASPSSSREHSPDSETCNAAGDQALSVGQGSRAHVQLRRGGDVPTLQLLCSHHEAMLGAAETVTSGGFEPLCDLSLYRIHHALTATA